MRLVLKLSALSVLASGCSILDSIEIGGPPKLDPNRIYLDGTELMLGQRADLDRYACMTGPLHCESWGASWHCRCP